MKTERRSFPTSEMRIEKRADGKPMITGHAAVFNQLSEDLGGFREQIAPGAFAPVLNDDVRALFNHDSNIILGRRTAGTLRLSQDEKGLAVEIDPPDSTLVRDMVLTPMERGDITQMSFGFRVQDDHWEEREGGKIVRTILKFARLYDVSPVAFAAYPQTDVALAALRSFEAQKNQFRQRRRMRLRLAESMAR